MNSYFFIKLKDYLFCVLFSCILSFLLFICLFHTPIFKNITVLMYRGIVFIIICGLFNFFVGALLKRYMFKSLDKFDLFSIMVLFCSITMCFFILVPVTVERSISVYMLSKMESEDKIYSKEDIEDVFINQYVIEFSAFDKRFEEQISTGTIDKVDNNKYIINDKGKFVVNLFRFISKLFNTDRRMVYPRECEYYEETNDYDITH